MKQETHTIPMHRILAIAIRGALYGHGSQVVARMIQHNAWVRTAREGEQKS